MIVRDYNPATDADVVKQLHCDMQMDYRLPDLENPLFIVRKVCVRDEQIIGVELLRLQAEAYLMLTPDLDPVEKTRTIAHLSRECENDAEAQGIDTIVAYIPEEISNKFSKRLTLLGWDKARKGWLTWFRELR